MAASPVLQSESRTSGWTPRSISSGQKPSPNESNWHPTPKSTDHLYLQTRSRHEAVHFDHSGQLTVLLWRGDFHRTSTLPLMWSASLSLVSQNFVYASLRHPQHPGFFSLRIANCDNLTIRCNICSGKLKFKEISIVFTETPRCIKASKW